VPIAWTLSGLGVGVAAAIAALIAGAQRSMR
jgi:hypothetical protein